MTIIRFDNNSVEPVTTMNKWGNKALFGWNCHIFSEPIQSGCKKLFGPHEPGASACPELAQGHLCG